MSEKKSLGAEEIVSERKLGRRSITMLGAAATGALATLGIVTTTGCCFGGTTGNTGTGAVSGCSDSDPNDPAGNGRNCAGMGAAPAAPGAVSGCSDSDPNDPAGNGRNCAGGMTSGCSDSDPVDPAGGGTHC